MKTILAAIDYGERMCNHCWHAFRGPLLMVVPDGHIVQKCCKCSCTRTVHVEHAFDHRPFGYKNTSWSLDH